jgi:hypothetical protein
MGPAVRHASQERFGRNLVTTLLHQEVQHHAVLVDCPPQPVRLALDLELHFVEMSFVTWAWASTTQLEGVRRAEFGTPLPDRLVAHGHAPLGQEFFDVAQAERKSEVQPNGMGDDL